MFLVVYLLRCTQSTALSRYCPWCFIDLHNEAWQSQTVQCTLWSLNTFTSLHLPTFTALASSFQSSWRLVAQGSLAGWMSNSSLGDDWTNKGCVECPVVQRWLTLDAVVTRGGDGKICDIKKLPLTREAVADNSEVLYPVIEHFGPLAGLNTVFNLLIWVWLNLGTLWYSKFAMW
jgi:hypothetical protein